MLRPRKRSSILAIAASVTLLAIHDASASTWFWSGSTDGIANYGYAPNWHLPGNPTAHGVPAAGDLVYVEDGNYIVKLDGSYTADFAEVGGASISGGIDPDILIDSLPGGAWHLTDALAITSASGNGGTVSIDGPSVTADQLRISDSPTFNIGTNTLLTANYIDVGRDHNGTGPVLNVTNSSRLVQSSGSACLVGNFSSGTINVNAGAATLSNVSICNYSGADLATHGAINVLNAGSVTQNIGALYIGQLGFSGISTTGYAGSLNISGSGSSYNFAGLSINVGTTSTVSAGTITVSSGGLFNIHPTILNLYPTGSLIINSGGAVTSSGVIEVEGGHLIDNGGGLKLTGGAGVSVYDGGTFSTVGYTFDPGAWIDVADGAHLISQGDLKIGNAGGDGSLNISGTGSASARGLYVGTDASSKGTCTLENSGSLTTTNNEYIGYNGIGTFVQDGGTNDLQGGQLHLGENSGAAGYYDLYDGVIKAAGIGVGQPGDGTAVFDQKGGMVLIGGLGIANNTLDSRGSYTLSHGSLTLTGSGSSSAIYVGGSGSGSFTQTGGVVSAAPGSTPDLYVGYTPGAVGTYSLSNGTLAFDNGSEYIGDSGNGAFVQSGGVHTTGALYIASGSSSSGSYNLTGGTLAVSSIYVGGSATVAGGTASLNVGSAATLTVAGMLKAWDAGSITLASPTRVGAIGTSGNGKIDITDSAVVVDYAPGPSPISTIASLIHSGYADGAWTGRGIISSTAQTDSGSSHPTAVGFAEASQLFSSFPATFMGLSIDSTSVLMRHTLSGDANLDGTVNALDFNLLASDYGQSADDWYQGDFNYDGVTSTTDFTALAMNFNQRLLASPLATLAPEPTCLAIATALLFARRRRRKFGLH